MEISTIKVLIVDDDTISSLVTSKNLERQGFEHIKSAITGEEAILLNNSYHPDVLLMDMRLVGNLNGIETSKIIRRTNLVPIIFFSSIIDPDEIEAAKSIENTLFFDRFSDFSTISKEIYNLVVANSK